MQRRDARTPHRRQGFEDLPQPRNGIEPRHDDAIRGSHDLVGPRETGDWQIDKYQVISQRSQIEEGIKRRGVQLANAKRTARSSKDVQAACMPADENFKELGIKTVGIIHDLLNFQTRLDVEI